MIGQTLLASMSTQKFYPLAQVIAFDIKTDPTHIAYVLNSIFSDPNQLVRAESLLRGCLGDASLLSVAGDLTKSGITSTNNPTVNAVAPASSVLFTTADQITKVLPAGMNNAYLKSFWPEFSASGQVNTAFYQQYSIPYVGQVFYLYGNHNPDQRIDRFLYIIFQRAKIGDSLIGAIKIAAQAMKIFGMANYSYKQEAWRGELPPQFDLSVPSDMAPFYTNFLKCFYAIVIKFYSELMVDEYAAWAAKVGPLADTTIPQNIGSVYNVSSTSTVQYLPWIAGAALWALAAISKKKAG